MRPGSWPSPPGKNASIVCPLSGHARPLGREPGGVFEVRPDLDRPAERLGTYAFLQYRPRIPPTASTSGCRGGSSTPPAGPARRPAISGRRSWRSRRPDQGVPRRTALAPYRLIAGADPAFQAAHLGRKEERLLAMQTEMARAAGQAFRQLNDADMKFGAVKDEKGQRVELSHGTLSHAAALAQPRRAQEGLPQVLPAIRGPPVHAGRHAGRLDPARHLLRPGPQLSQRAGGGLVSRPHAGERVRQPDRLGAAAPAGRCTTITMCGGGRCG